MELVFSVARKRGSTMAPCACACRRSAPRHRQKRKVSFIVVVGCVDDARDVEMLCV